MLVKLVHLLDFSTFFPKFVLFMRRPVMVSMSSFQIKKKKEKLQDLLKHRLGGEAKKATDKIKTMTADLEYSKKTLDKVSEKLVTLKQQICDVERELDAAGTSYVTLDKKCKQRFVNALICFIEIHSL